MSRTTWAATALLSLLACTVASAHVGESDTAGYYWVDDREAGFGFLDARLSEPLALPLIGDTTSPLRLPFSFSYYGRVYDHVQVSADGSLILSAWGGETTVHTDAGYDVVRYVPPRDDTAVLHVLQGVVPSDASKVLFAATGTSVTLRWVDFRAGETANVTFEAHLREDGLIRFQYLDVNALLNGADYGSIGRVGLTDPTGRGGLELMSHGMPEAGFDLRSGGVVEFPRFPRDPRPDVVQCPPAFGLPADAPTWCDRVLEGFDGMMGTADDGDPNCITNAGAAPNTACATSVTQQWEFNENAFCADCPYVLYVRIDCGSDMHIPTHDVEAMRVSVTDLNDGTPQVVTGENECAKRRDEPLPPAGMGPFAYCDGCALAGAIFPKDDPVPEFGKAAGSCTASDTPIGPIMLPETPCIAWREVGTEVCWGQPIDSDGDGDFVDDMGFVDDMACPPCETCDEPVCPCGGTTGANRATEEQVIDVVLAGSPSLTGIYRLEILSGGFVWQLFTNCDGTPEAQYFIYDNCADALADYNPLPELSLDQDPDLAFFIDDETNCPDSLRVGVTTCNIGGDASTLAPFTISYLEPVHSAPTDCNMDGDTTDPGEAVGERCMNNAAPVDCNGDGDMTDFGELVGQHCTQVVPFDGDNANHPTDLGCQAALEIGECRTCFWDVPLLDARGMPVSGAVATLRVDDNFDVDECSEVPDAVRCTIEESVRVRQLPVCAAACQILANGEVAPIDICLGETVTLDSVGTTVSACLDPEYQFEEWDGAAWVPIPGGEWSGNPDFTYTPATDGTHEVQIRVRCASDPACESATNETEGIVIEFTVAPDTDFDTVCDADDNCIDTPNTDQSDIDFDGIGDLCDNCPANSNVDQTDSDGDTVGDECDNCVIFANPGQEDDDDGDGVHGEVATGDDDGVGDACDNCVNVANNAFEDLNMDGAIVGTQYGEFPQADNDGDGIGDLCDTCWSVFNVNVFEEDCNGDGDTTDPGEGPGEQCDEDGDGVGDACDNCETTPNMRIDDPFGFDCNGDGDPDDPGEAFLAQCDQDQDGVGDECDNCPTTLNPAQTDDDDQDGVSGEPGEDDGIGNACDNCPTVFNPGQEDDDMDGIGNACEDLCSFTPPEALSGVIGDDHLVVTKDDVGILLTSAKEDGSPSDFFFGSPPVPGLIDHYNAYRGNLSSLRNFALGLDDPARYDHETFTTDGGGSSCDLTDASAPVHDAGALTQPDNYYYVVVAECAAQSIEGPYGYQCRPAPGPSCDRSFELPAVQPPGAACP